MGTITATNQNSAFFAGRITSQAPSVLHFRTSGRVGRCADSVRRELPTVWPGRRRAVCARVPLWGHLPFRDGRLKSGVGGCADPSEGGDAGTANLGYGDPSMCWALKNATFEVQNLPTLQ